MYDYIKGTITGIKNNAIVLDNNGIGYLVYVANPFSFELGEEYKVYIYQQIQEDGHFLYGFKLLEEKDLFLKLISVKGVGCKMALPFLSTGSISGIMDAIERENVLYLKKFPKIGEKVARQIILDLKGKLAVDAKETKQDYTELTETLKSLGYKPADIKRILPNIDINKTLELQVKDALKLLLK